MKHISYLLVVATFFIVLPGFTGHDTPGQIKVLNSTVKKNGNNLQTEFILDYSQLSIASNDQLIVQPVIIGTNDTLRLPYLLFPGKTRSKANFRKIRLYGTESTLLSDTHTTLYPSKKASNVYNYSQNTPFEKWMYGARIELWQDVYGCADCHKVLAKILLNDIANPPLVAFITPKADTIREEHIILYISFPWNQAIIRHDFRNNATELDKINQSMQHILNERKGQIHRIVLTGYASPEGKYAYNSRLASKRVEAVKDYLTEIYPTGEILFTLESVPEDWEGLKKWVQNSPLQHNKDVTDIIDRISTPDERDQFIRHLDNSVTYNRLLREAYPLLRRVEYKVNYHMAPLSLEQCRKIYLDNPCRLTPQELFTLANSYPKGTPEFYTIILTTARLYPQNTAAQNNAACVALMQEDLESARIFLGQSESSPQDLNNRGVLFMLEGNYPEAYQYFRSAGNHGCMEAITNQQNLEKTQLQY